MTVTSSYGVEIRKMNICFRKTLEYYRGAVAWLITAYESVWEELKQIPGTKQQFNAAEHMVHHTKQNLARFPFDFCFPKMPSYLRRAAITHALGAVSSYHTRLDKWEAAGQEAGKGTAGKPVLNTQNHAMPVFYLDNMYREGEPGTDTARLKLYNGHDWVWEEVRLRHTDMEYLRKHWAGHKASAPVLEKKYKKYFLRFSYTQECPLSEKPAPRQVVCAVDLGINTDAVCSIIKYDGTVLARKFIDFPSEKDHLYHALGRVRRFQREHGSRQSAGRWSYAKRLNEELAGKVAGAVTEFARANRADVIVFEYLDMHKKIHGGKKQKLHMWRKRDIQKRCMHQAHRCGIRVARVCARNTSAMAFDGSGRVNRDPKNHRLCTFQNGKKYNCDLSASYNIGARYFIRELLKPLPETARSLLEAKVPAAKRRTSCVYADFLVLYQEYRNTQAA